MQRENLISHIREELAEAVGSEQVSPPSPLECSPWIAMSLMQKAIRRGREDLALRAAATLLRDSPERLWRRCGVIAFEDIGVADLATAGKALALRYGVGTSRRPSDYLRSRIGEPHAVFDHLLDAGLPSSAVEIAREGFSRIVEPLCPLVALLSALLPSQPHRLADDEFPPERMIGEAPSWALDFFTREGRSAIRRFLARDSATSRWTKKNVPGDKCVEFLGYLIFAVEGGLRHRHGGGSLLAL